MKYLLDTNALLFWLGGSDRLTTDVRDVLADRQNVAYVSAVSGFEMALKASLGRLRLPDVPSRVLPVFLASAGLTVLDISLKHGLAVYDLPPLHGDPFDRLLIAQAQCERLTVVTSDRQIAKYDVSVLFID